MSGRRRRRKDSGFRTLLLLVVFLVLFGGGMTAQNKEFLVSVVIVIAVMLLAMNVLKGLGSGRKNRSLIDRLIDSSFDEEWVGKRGEMLTERELKYVKFFGRDGYTLRNVYLPKDNGETSEIDLLFITQKGIFVFESKNFSGWIFGNDEDRYWTASLPNGQKNKFYNPIMQNRTHIKWLQNYIGEGIPIFSIIVFSERCELKNITVQTFDARVIKRDQTYAVVRDLWDEHPDCLSEQSVRELYDALSPLTNVDASVKAAHIENIERKYKSSATTAAVMPETEEEVEVYAAGDAEEVVVHTAEEELVADASEVVVSFAPRKCPKCGSEMVLRTAREGSNAGKQFYGCSAFPKCRYVQDIE